MPFSYLKKSVVGLLVFLVAAGPILAPLSQGFNFPERYDLVAILVEQGLYRDAQDYDGLVERIGAPLQRTNIKQRVDRYAIDLQKALPGTRALVLQVDRFEKPENIAAVLERLYFDGDPQEPSRSAHLAGLVLVGEVPLPVVNKNGTRFISLFPYTDFSDKAYSLNATTRDFEFKGEGRTPQPEVWHGVIRPPVSTQNPEGKSLLAEYFDKNHLYHSGDERYTTFAKRMFFQDFVAEGKNLSPIAYKNYLKFLEHQDDIAYLRYTRQLYKDLAASSEEDLAEDDVTRAAREDLEAAGITFDQTIPPGADIPDDVAEAANRPVNKDEIPDIMTKVAKMSDKLMMRFNELFTKYPNMMNDLVKSTGRYLTPDGDNYKLDVDSAINLITAKDQYTLSYLKQVNTMVEDKIDEFVDGLQKPIEFRPITFRVTSVEEVGGQHVDADEAIPSALIPPPGAARDLFLEGLRTLGQPLPGPTIPDNYGPELTFTNYVPGYTVDELTYFPRERLARDRAHGGNEPMEYPAHINGYTLDELSSVSQCTLLRGSNGAVGSYAKVVEGHRALNISSNKDYNDDDEAFSGRTPAESRSNYACYPDIHGGRCQAIEHFGGCYFDGTNLFEQPENGTTNCFPNHATDPIFDPAGTREITRALPAGYDDYRACYNFRDSELLVKERIAADERLENIDDNDDDNVTREDRVRRLNAMPEVPNADPNPNNFDIFHLRGEYRLKLGTLLRAVGWNEAGDESGRGWKNILAQFLHRSLTLGHLSIPVVHPDVAQINIDLSAGEVEKTISSVFRHKEPTNATLNAQAESLITKDLPVDHPRYVIFQTFNDAPEKIIYPDIFKAASLDEYRAQLQAVEARINALRVGGANAPECRECLSGLISNLPENAETPPNSEGVVRRANQAKVTDAIAWHDMDLDAKHAYVITTYIDARSTGYIGDSVDGYELAYFNGNGGSDHYSFSLTAGLDGNGTSTTNGAGNEPEEPYEDDPNNPFDGAADRPEVPEGGYDLFSFSPPPISPWWEEMKKWAADIQRRVTTPFQSGASAEDFYAKQKAATDKEKADIAAESEALAANPQFADQIETSHISTLTLDADTGIVVADRRIVVNLAVKDKDGVMVTDEFAQVTLTLEGGGRILNDDERADAPDTQISVIEGKATVQIAAPATPSRLIFKAQLAESEIAAEREFTIVSTASLAITSATTALVANGRTRITLDLAALDEAGSVITSAQGRVHVGLSDTLMGRLEESEVQLRAGRAQLHFVAGLKKGTAVINATSSTIDPGQIALTLLPGPAVRLGLSSDGDVLPVKPGSTRTLKAQLFDRNNNAIDANNELQVNFELSPDSQVLATLSAPAAQLNRGVAAVTLSPKNRMGTITATASAEGFAPATIRLKSVKELDADQLRTMEPKLLAVALLGIPAGDVSRDDALGSWFTMRGKVQAATTLTTSLTHYKKILEITENGGLTFPQAGRVEASFLPANNFTMLIRDTQLSTDLATMTIVTRKDGQFAVTENSDPTTLTDGIYIRKTTQDPAYFVDVKKGALRVAHGESDVVEIQTNGFVRLFDNAFTVRPKAGVFLTLEILKDAAPVAEVTFVQRFAQDVRLVDDESAIRSDTPGVYIVPRPSAAAIRVESSLTGNSSALPRGVNFVDTATPVTGASAPGFGFTSLEDSTQKFGVGFGEDNKFGLLFSSGETFGEANRSYASDVGIVLGDPTVRITQPANGSFTQDIGKLIYAGSAAVRSILPLDYNADGFEDILVVEADGHIRLIQNNGGYDTLKDEGYLFNIKNGIQDVTKADLNNDGLMDIVIATSQSCHVDDTCIDTYINTRGAFTRKNLRIDQKEKVITIRTEDLNGDELPEIIFADAAGDIKVIYNENGTFSTEAQKIGNVGIQVDPRKNGIQSVLVRYNGLPNKITEPRNEEDVEQMKKYETLSLPESNAALQGEGFAELSQGEGLSVDAGTAYIERDFIYADEDDDGFSNSTKFAQDLNGDILKSGDRVRYTITLRNADNSARNNVFVSDLIAAQLEVDEASITCGNCAAGEMKVIKLRGDPTRTYLFSGLRIPAGQERTIVYEAVYKGDPETVAKITLTFSTHFTDSDPVLGVRLAASGHPVLAVSKEDNTTGQVRYFYAVGTDPNDRLIWGSGLSSPETPEGIVGALQGLGLGLPPLNELTPGTDDDGNPTPPSSSTHSLEAMQTGDADGDGIQDIIDDVNGGLDRLADATQNAVNKLTCAAGCVALPVNYAFLAPGFVSVLGTPTSYDIGMPVFGWGVPSLVPTWPPSGTPSFGSLGGRLYVSPTLTGGVGFSVCLGPFGTARNCFSFGANPVDLLPGNICDSINGAIGGALASANEAIAEANEGMTMSLGGSGAGLHSGREGGTGFSNYSLGSYEPAAANGRNIRVPGFPAVLTNWWSRQLEEIEKAMDIPDLYLIYPDVDSVIGAFKPVDNLPDAGDPILNVLSYVNSIPLIDIQTDEVLFKIPIITQHEIDLFKADAAQWIEDEKLELDRWLNAMGCLNPVGKNFMDLDVCNFVQAEMGKLISTLVENSKRLDDWILFPKKILQFRAVETFYLNQIIDYIDTIINFTGGWVKRNTARVKEWRRAVRNIKNIIENYKALIDLMIDYNATCDNCKTERYGLKELILKLFMAIPSPPVIPLPKLPDIVVDVSKIQAGVTIHWPDVRFAPAPITLPRIPRISLGINLTIPKFKLLAPALPLIPLPPELPTLPQLPPLNLPKLPDLPPPPTLPALPNQLTAMIDILKKIVKILCIIRLGFTPTDEVLLKHRIEEITARGLTPILPIDLLFKITAPTISVTYVDKIVVTVFTNLRTDLSFIQDAVEAVAEQANGFSTNLTKGVNKYTDALSKQLEKFTSPTIDIGPVGGEAERTLNYSPQEVGRLSGAVNELRESIASLREASLEYGEKLAAIPSELKLTAESSPFIAAKDDSEDGSNEAAETLAQNEAEDSPVQGAKNLISYRDALRHYVAQNAGESSSNSLPPPDSSVNLHTIVSSLRGPAELPNLKRFMAARDGVPSERGADQPQRVKVNDRLVAVAQQPILPNADGGVPGATPGTGGPGGNGSVQNIGIFFVDPQGKSKRLINYTLEADKESHLADIDIEKDGDLDKLYSYGNNLYLKRSSRIIHEDERQVFRDVDIEFATIYELLPPATSPSNIKITAETSHATSLSFDPSVALNGEVAGYEIIAKHSPAFFEVARTEATFRTHLMATANTNSASSGVAGTQPIVTLTLSNIDGSLLINGEPHSGSSVSVGDVVTTGDDSSALLRASDGTVMRISENTSFAVTQGTPFHLAGGRLEVTLPAGGGQLFTPGITLDTQDGGVLRLRLSDGSDMSIDSATPFTLPTIAPVLGTVTRLGGGAHVTGPKRELASNRDGTVHLKPGEWIHPLEVVTLTWNKDQPGARQMTLSESVAVVVPETLTSGVDIEVSDGVIELVHTQEVTTAPAYPGMAVSFDDTLKLDEGTMVIAYSNGGETVLRGNETLTIKELGDPAKPAAELALDPAFYTAKIAAIMSDGKRSTLSQSIIFAPQICGDSSNPFANFGSTSFQVAVGKILPLDASPSFDPAGEVVAYFLDTDTSVDSDGDGDATNDHDQFTDLHPEVDADQDGNTSNDGDSPDFVVGPFEEAGTITMELTVLDEAGNEGHQTITIVVVTPRIILDVPPLKNNIITGHIEPPDENVPISIAHRRDGLVSEGWQLLVTPTANGDEQYLTDKDGRFTITDADLRPRLLVKDREGQVIAEISEATGRITILDALYETRFMPPQPPDIPARIGVFLKSDPGLENPVTFVYYIPDVNTDTTIDGPQVVYRPSTVARMSGAHIKPLQHANESGIRFRILDGDDPEIPGATIAEEGDKRLVAIDVNGNIIASNPAVAVREVQTQNVGGDEPVVFEITYKDEAIAQVYVAVGGARGRGVKVVDQPTPPARPKPKGPRAPAGPPPFTDVNAADPFAATARKLFDRGIIAGYKNPVSGELTFRPESSINRAEFTQITLKMLCIIPREEARKLPPVFYDVLDPKLWFYPVLKEGNIRTFIKGYLGEARVDAQTGKKMAPFKPANTITRAEAATIVLAALNEQNVIDLSKADLAPRRGDQWYDPYVRVAQNVTPYLVKQKPGMESFLITRPEALNPTQLISRRDFAIMAERVLLMHDCYAPDNDGDGLDDIQELKYVQNIEQMTPDGDLDGDDIGGSCTNARELELGTDPTKMDTDNGGSSDCVEAVRGTDPLNKIDDKPALPPEILKNQEGIYVSRPACNTCPCNATIVEGAALQPLDLIFAAITGPHGLPIFARSNQAQY